MSTEKLYYTDSHIDKFTARVTSCRPHKQGWLVTLDKTAFFPEGGGQAADSGYIGKARVTDVREREGEIWHSTDAELREGEEYPCRLDWEQRLCRMQNHSGEHIVSGLIHSLYGFENVGFHMGEDCVTVDFSGELAWEQLTEVETRANEAVRADLPVRCRFPDSEELSRLEYRSKLELKENIRIVEIEGIDCCACCAPHVRRSGEIGMVKLLDSVRHRGGVRVSMVCGMDALRHFRQMQENVAAISAMLSARRDMTSAAVERVLAERQSLKERLAALGMDYVRLKGSSFEYSHGNLCIFNNELDETALRELANALADKCSGMAAVFSGSDGQGYKYVIVSRHSDLRAKAGAINRALGGRGGGSAEMLRGSATATGKMIQEFVESDAV